MKREETTRVWRTLFEVTDWMRNINAGLIDQTFLNLTSEISAREIGLMTNCHRKPCSCVQCGNPRRYGELPPAERRAALNQRDTGEEDFPAA